MTKLTEQQKEIINQLNVEPYTAEYVEEWINRKDSVFENAPAALTAMGAHGFYAAVKVFEEIRKDQEYKDLTKGICIACSQIIIEDMDNAMDTVISILQATGIDRSEAERCDVAETDLARLEEAFKKMEVQK
jgi:hypothetical protein